MKRIFFVSLAFVLFCRSETELLTLPNANRKYDRYVSETTPNLGYPDCLDYILEIDIPDIKYIPIDENLRLYLQKKYPDEKITEIAFPFRSVFRLREILTNDGSKKRRKGKYLNYSLSFDSTSKESEKYRKISSQLIREFDPMRYDDYSNQDLYDKKILEKYVPTHYPKNGNLCHTPPSSIQLIVGKDEFYLGEDCRKFENEIRFAEFVHDVANLLNHGYEFHQHPDGKDFRFVTVDKNRCIP